MHRLLNLPKSTLLFFLGWTSYFLYLWSNILWFDPAGNLMAGGVSIWADWAAHLTMQSQFAYRSLSTFTSPFLIGQTLSYPFVSDWLSGALVTMGVPIFVAPTLLSAGWSLALVGALWWFFTTLLGSQKRAIVASCLFLLNGGLGFWYFFQDILRADRPLAVLLAPPIEYTSIEAANIHWINIIPSMIIPQRAFVMGFPIALALLTIVLRNFFIRTKPPSLLKSSTLGLLLGLLAIIHTHSFLAVGIILACWSSGDILARKNTPNKKLLPRLLGWSSIALCALSIALPLSYYFFGGTVSGHFFTWLPGWYTNAAQESLVLFWLKNWGVLPPLALFGFWVALKSAPDKKTTTFDVYVRYAPFFLLFILVNLVLFQPFIWDNTKLLVWVSLGFSALATLGLEKLWRVQNRSTLSKNLAITLFCLATLSGGIDAYHTIQFKQHAYQMYSAEELSLAQWARESTPPDSIWLTSDQHNHWVSNLMGRQTLMAYRGWLWTYGYDYTAVQADISKLFQNPQESRELFATYGISYVVVGPSEKNTWNAKKHVFERLFTTVKKTENYTILQVTPEQ